MSAKFSLTSAFFKVFPSAFVCYFIFNRRNLATFTAGRLGQYEWSAARAPWYTRKLGTYAGAQRATLSYETMQRTQLASSFTPKQQNTKIFWLLLRRSCPRSLTSIWIRWFWKWRQMESVSQRFQLTPLRISTKIFSVHQFETATDTRLQFTTTGRLSQTFESLRFLDEYCPFFHSCLGCLRWLVYNSL